MQLDISTLLYMPAFRVLVYSINILEKYSKSPRPSNLAIRNTCFRVVTQMLNKDLITSFYSMFILLNIFCTV